MTTTSITDSNKQTCEQPIDRFLALLKGSKATTRGYIATCPGPIHKAGDRHSSLEVWQDETDGHVGLKCYVGCTRKEIVEAVFLTEQDLYKPDSSRPQGPARPTIDQYDLSRDKDIHPHLFTHWGIHDGSKEECTFIGKDGQPYVRKGVVIPYYNEDGSLYERYRVRTALKAKDGTPWNHWDEKTKGKRPAIPYGLNRLDDARKSERKELIIVEGESDCWTLWQWKFHALGLPGANNIACLKPEHLRGIERIVIIREPDEAGTLFVDKLYKHLKSIHYEGRVYALSLYEATGCKDPNELQHKDMATFKTTMRNALLNDIEPLFPSVPMPTIARLCDLQDEILPAMQWAIPDILPEGLTWLAGKPKLGKSWLLLAMLLAIAAGTVVLGNMPVESGEVLYISLEDNKRRLQKRTNLIMNKAKAHPNFFYSTAADGWKRLDEGGLEQLEEYILAHPKLRIIGIDTWAKIKPKVRSSQQYDEDYDALSPLQELAAKHHIAIVAVHHMRKQEAEDPLDTISGSTAMQGAVDGFLLLYRKRGETDARLFVTGRDIEEEQELLLSFNQECATWTIKGDEFEHAGTREQQAILDAMREHDQPIALKDLASNMAKNIHTTRNLLVKLRSAGKVVLRDNLYCVVTHSNHSNHSNLTSLSTQLPLHDTGNEEGVTTPTEVTTVYYGDDTAIVTPLNGLVEQSQEVQSSEVTTPYYDNVLRHSNLPPTELDQEAKQHFIQLLAHLKTLKKVDRVMWVVPGQDLYPEIASLTKQAYAAQMKQLLCSGDARNIQAAIEAIELKLGRVPGRKGDNDS